MINNNGKSTNLPSENKNDQVSQYKRKRIITLYKVFNYYNALEPR